MSAIDKKSDVFNFSETQTRISCWKSYYFFEQRAFKRFLSFVLMQMCARYKEHTREVIDCVLRSLHGLPGQRS